MLCCGPETNNCLPGELDNLLQCRGVWILPLHELRCDIVMSCHNFIERLDITMGIWQCGQLEAAHSWIHWKGFCRVIDKGKAWSR